MMEFNKRNIRTWSRLGSCGAFGLALLDAAEKDEKLIALTADLLYYSGLERFSHQYPDRLYNVGIAEQNMVAIAAAMAKEGFNPFATTYATFASTRACDQVRVNMGYMQLPVKLIGLTAGLTTGILGATHMSFEDLSIIRTIPNITVLSPADCTETVKATLAMAKHDGPVYMRLTGIMGAPIVYNEDYDYEIGTAIKLRSGEDIALFATGSMVYYAKQAAEQLEQKDIQCSLYDMHTIKPIDAKAITESCSARLIVTLEEHSVIGGLGSAVSEALSGYKQKPPQLMIGLEDKYLHAASYEYLMEEYGLTTEKIVEKIEKKYCEVNS